MEAFSDLCQRLESSYTAEQQVMVLNEGLSHLPDLSFAWTVFWLMGYKLKRLVSKADLQAFAMQQAHIDEHLFNLSLAHVRDFPENIALLCCGGQVETHLNLVELAHLHIHDLREMEHGPFWAELRKIYGQLAIGPARIWTAMLLGRSVVGDYKQALFTALAQLYQKEPVLLQLFLTEKWRPHAGFRQEMMEQVPDLGYRAYFRHFQRPNAAPLGSLPIYSLEESATWLAQPLVGGLAMQVRQIEDQVWLFDGEAVWPGELIIPEWSAQAFAPNYTYNIILRRTESSADYQNEQMVRKALADGFKRRNSKKSKPEAPRFDCWCYLAWNNVSKAKDSQPQLLFGSELTDNTAFWPPTRLKPVIESASDSQQATNIPANWHLVETQQLAAVTPDFPKHWFKGPLKGLVVHQLPTGKMVQYGIQRHRLRLILLYFKRGFGPDGIEELTFGVYQDAAQPPSVELSPESAETVPVLVPLWRLPVTPELAQVQNLKALLQEYIVERFGPVRSVKPVFVIEVSFTGVTRSKRHKAGVQLVDAVLEQWLGEASAVLTPHSLADCLQLLHA
jgi:DNA ligase 1